MSTFNSPIINIQLATQLINEHFPQWAGLAIEPVASAGTDNALFHLGEAMLIRLPNAQWAYQQVEKEQRWLPLMADHLPIDIPRPIAMGRSSVAFEHSWSIYNWLDGSDLSQQSLENLDQAAIDLAAFIRALQSRNSSGGPRAGAHNNYRGIDLSKLDSVVRSSIDELGSRIDGPVISELWQCALNESPWQQAPVWLHGDIHPGNILAKHGRISAVIDFGLMGVGDPACDLLVAWNLLAHDSRQLFRQHLQVDDSTWARGRGWALYTALVALPYYWSSNPVIVAMAQRTLNEILADSALW